MKSLNNITIFSLICLLPNSSFLTSGVFGGQIEVLYCLIAVAGLLCLRSAYRMVAVAKQGAVVSQLDIFVIVYLLYGVINVAFIHTVAIDQMLIFQWIAILSGYFLFRSIKIKKLLWRG